MEPTLHKPFSLKKCLLSQTGTSALFCEMLKEKFVYLFFLSFQTQISIIYFLLTTITYYSTFNFLFRSYESVGHTCANNRGESFENVFQWFVRVVLALTVKRRFFCWGSLERLEKKQTKRSNPFKSNFCRLRFSYVVVNLSTKEVKRGNCQSLIKDWIFLYNKHPI